VACSLLAAAHLHPGHWDNSLHQHGPFLGCAFWVHQRAHHRAGHGSLDVQHMVTSGRPHRELHWWRQRCHKHRLGTRTGVSVVHRARDLLGLHNLDLKHLLWYVGHRCGCVGHAVHHEHCAYHRRFRTHLRQLRGHRRNGYGPGWIQSNTHCDWQTRCCWQHNCGYRQGVCNRECCPCLPGTFQCLRDTLRPGTSRGFDQHPRPPSVQRTPPGRAAALVVQRSHCEECWPCCSCNVSGSWQADQSVQLPWYPHRQQQVHRDLDHVESAWNDSSRLVGPGQSSRGRIGIRT